MKSCLFCNKEIIKRPNQSNYDFESKKYCSLDCAYENRKGDKSPRWRNAKKKVECKQCGKEMLLYDCQPRVFCSIKCRSQDEEWRKNHSDSIKGMEAWNKGLKGVQPWMNMSGLNSSTGFVWNKGKKNPNMTGEKNHNWKGGVTKDNHKIRTSLEYKQWRTSVFERDNYTCQMCGDRSSKGNKVVLHADHIKQFAYYPELRLDVDNGRTLCVDCHRKTDSYCGKGKIKKQIAA